MSSKKKPTVTTTKEKVINVRCTEEQQAALKQIAAQEGLGVSTWLLHVGLRVAKERRAEKQ